MLRKPLNEINDEQDRLTKLKQRTRLSDVDLDRLVQPQTDQPIDVRRDNPITDRVASRDVTSQRMRNVVANDDIMSKLRSIDHTATDEITDTQARQNADGDVTDGYRPEPIKPNMLPKVITKDLQAAGVVTPEWHMVKNLPGYLSSPIRSIGRAVFKPFTRTPIEEVQVLANLLGNGPNKQQEMNAVAQYLVTHGKRDRDAELVFHDKIPDYGAEIKVVRHGGVTYLIVQDFAGHYIYAWPSDHEYQKVSNIPDLTKESVEPKKKSARFQLNQAIVTKKAGGHYSEKLDYKRSNEKAKARKQIKDELK